MKRSVHDNRKIALLRDLSRSNRATKGKLLPRGFRHVVIDGEMHLKNLRTGETTRLTGGTI